MSYINQFRIAMAGAGGSCSSCMEKSQDEEASHVVSGIQAKTTQTVNIPTTLTEYLDSIDPDIEALEGRFGELRPGMEIVLELGDACDLLGRTRRRTDAFKGLTKRLQDDYGVTLTIKSRKSHE